VIISTLQINKKVFTLNYSLYNIHNFILINIVNQLYLTFIYIKIYISLNIFIVIRA